MEEERTIYPEDEICEMMVRNEEASDRTAAPGQAGQMRSTIQKRGPDDARMVLVRTRLS